MSGTDPLDGLERGQVCAETARRLPRATLGRATIALLIGLRIYVLLAIPIVAYAFFRALRAGAGK